MIVRTEGNQLFFDNDEVRESACHRQGTPAHDRNILCVGHSPTGKHIVSIEDGGKVKVWDSTKEKYSQRVWVGSGFPTATAISITEDARRLAIAEGLIVSVYDLIHGGPHPNYTRLETATLVLRDRITFMQFTDPDHVACSDADGKKIIFTRDPSWKATIDK